MIQGTNSNLCFDYNVSQMDVISFSVLQHFQDIKYDPLRTSLDVIWRSNF